MNKGEFISAVASQAGVTKEMAAKCYEGMVDTIKEALAKGEKIALLRYSSASFCCSFSWYGSFTSMKMPSCGKYKSARTVFPFGNLIGCCISNRMRVSSNLSQIRWIT